MIWNILGIGYILVVLWCIWEAHSAPVMPDDYDEN
jgi:hypothetical protein